MGNAKRRLENMKAMHPRCCLCAEGNPTESIEHAPPKVMFWHKHRPKGFEVPACKRCNENSSNADQLAAFIALSQSNRGDDFTQEESDYFDKVMRGVNNNIGNIKDILKLGKESGIYGAIHYDHDELFKKHLGPWAAKQTLAHWFDITGGRILSSNGLVAVRWQTNYELAFSQEFSDLILKLEKIAELKAGSWSVLDQFLLRYSLNTEEGIFAIFAAYHNCGFIGFLIEDRSKLKGRTLKILGNRGSAYFPCKTNGLTEFQL